MDATAETLRFGLRFKRTDELLLNRLAERVRSGEIDGEVDVFEQAALAARTGEPLVAHCTKPEEILAMAAGYVLNGLDQPAIEELSG